MINKFEEFINEGKLNEDDASDKWGTEFGEYMTRMGWMLEKADLIDRKTLTSRCVYSKKIPKNQDPINSKINAGKVISKYYPIVWITIELEKVKAREKMTPREYANYIDDQLNKLI